MSDLSKIVIDWDDDNRPTITVLYSSDGEHGGSGMQADPEEWLTALADRVSENGARFLTEMIRKNEERDFISLADFAQEIGEDKKVVDGWNRNLGRSVKAVVREYGFLRTDADDGTQQLFDYKWDQPKNQWLYVIPAKYRGTLKQALTEE
jgi:hypothetical protein